MKWQRRHFRKLLEVARFSLRDVTMAKIVGTNKLPSSPPPPAIDQNIVVQYVCIISLTSKSMRLNIVRDLVKQLTGQRTASK